MRHARLVRVCALTLALFLVSGCNYFVKINPDTSPPQLFASENPDISADGRYVAFVSSVFSGGHLEEATVYVRDLRTSQVTRIGPGNGPSISGDGQVVAFVSVDAHGPSSVVVRDLQANTTTQISVDPHGADPNGSSFNPQISGDGHRVAFLSTAGDLLVAGRPAPAADLPFLFVRDLQTNSTVQASVGAAGGDPNNQVDTASISADGRRVAFTSFASNLVPGDANETQDVFVRDLSTDTTIRASADSTGGDANNISTSPSLTADGRFVVFDSTATDLVPSDGNFASDVFMRDLQTGVTTRISVSADGGDSLGDPIDSETPFVGSVSGDVSGDGRYVAFLSVATNLVTGETSTDGIFLRDTRTGSTTRLSVNDLGARAGTQSGPYRLSADGHYVAFTMFADGATSFVDVFVRSTQVVSVGSVAPATLGRGETATLTVKGTNFLPGARVATVFGAGGITVNSVSVVSETELRVSVTAAADAATGTRNVTVFDPGTGPGVAATGFGLCGNCLTVT
jgi:Tol biopolymer transport system component